MWDEMRVEWLVPGRVLRVPGSTDQDVIVLRNRMLLTAINNEGQKPLVHCIIDHRNQYSAAQVQRQPLQMRYYMESADETTREKLLSNPMLGWVISVAIPNVAMKMAASVVSQQKNYRWRDVETIEAAFDWLSKVDSTLPDLAQTNRY